jgi:DNA topoisomerase IB
MPTPATVLEPVTQAALAAGRAAMFHAVAEHLGNTSARKSYVDPRLLDRYEDSTFGSSLLRGSAMSISRTPSYAPRPSEQ